MLQPEQRASFAPTLRPLLVTRPIDRYLRISTDQYRDTPLGMGSASTRFSPTDTRRGDKDKSFQVIYLAEHLQTALYETIVRQGLDYRTTRALTSSDYSGHVLFTISTTDPRAGVTLLDLTNSNALHHGVPSDVLQHSRHDDGQNFAEMVYDHLPEADGILYHSRFTQGRCVAVFDRATDRLVAETIEPLTRTIVRYALKDAHIDVY